MYLRLPCRKMSTLALLFFGGGTGCHTHIGLTWQATIGEHTSQDNIIPERFGLGLTKYLAKNGVFWHF